MIRKTKLFSTVTKILGLALLLTVNHLNAQQGTSVKRIGNDPVWKTGAFFALQVPDMKENNLYFDALKNEVHAQRFQFLEPGYQVKSHPSFQFPIKLKDGGNIDDRYVISGYTDHDTLFPGALLDYRCGDLTYDLGDGYNHTGTDFFIWPYPWLGMYTDEVEVISMAPGIILFKQDGNFDQNCDGSALPFNGISVLHEDGSVAWYVHLKKNSLTLKMVGEPVETGEYLGVVGSSGSSLSPHLHIEVYDTAGNLIDPFNGPCNETVDESWWQEQPAYKKPAINRLSIHDRLPEFPDCPMEEIPHEHSVFYPGDTIFLVTYFKNIFPGDTVEYTIRRPDNSIFASWFWYSPWDFYTASWRYNFTLATESDVGQWSVSAMYKGTLYTQSYQVLESQGVTVRNGQTVEIKIHPNPASSKIYIETQTAGSLHIEIFNLSGKSVAAQTTKGNGQTVEIDISELVKGLYFIKITNEKGIFVSKVTKH